jgi:hypothetical protein
VEAPLAFSVEFCPTQIVEGVAVTIIFGAGFTVMTCVALVLPFTLVAVSVTVNVPADAHVTPVTFCDVAFGGVPLGKVQLQLVGVPVELSVKSTESPTQIDVALAVNAAIGPGQEFTVTVTVAVFVQPAALVPVTV